VPGGHSVATRDKAHLASRLARPPQVATWPPRRGQLVCLDTVLACKIEGDGATISSRRRATAQLRAPSREGLPARRAAGGVDGVAVSPRPGVARTEGFFLAAGAGGRRRGGVAAGVHRWPVSRARTGAAAGAPLTGASIFCHLPSYRSTARIDGQRNLTVLRHSTSQYWLPAQISEVVTRQETRLPGMRSLR